MRKKELITKLHEQENKLREQENKLKEQEAFIKEQSENFENMLDIFKILVEGGDVSLQIYQNRKPAYFVHPIKGKTDAKFSKRIYEGLFSRGLLTSKKELVLEDFATQHYILRLPKEISHNEEDI